jgi:hypothetical protein
MRLAGIVRHYETFVRQRKQEELDWFRNQPTLEANVKQAALSQGRDGKRLSHQWRIKARVLQEAKRALLAVLSDLRNCSNFDQLFSIVEEALEPVQGAGALYAYDVAERIGAKLRLEPEKVYLHAGAAVGAARLGLDTSRRAIERSSLPTALQRIAPGEVEDVLCIYRDDFEVVSIGDGNPNTRSSCLPRPKRRGVC